MKITRAGNISKEFGESLVKMAQPKNAYEKTDISPEHTEYIDAVGYDIPNNKSMLSLLRINKDILPKVQKLDAEIKQLVDKRNQLVNTKRLDPVELDANPEIVLLNDQISKLRYQKDALMQESYNKYRYERVPGEHNIGQEFKSQASSTKSLTKIAQESYSWERGQYPGTVVLLNNGEKTVYNLESLQKTVNKVKNSNDFKTPTAKIKLYDMYSEGLTFLNNSI